MAGHPSKEEEELPARYFSSLYYDKQQKRGLPNQPGLPTVEELAELEKLKTDYEGKSYDIPPEMLDITDAKKKFEEIDQARKNAGLGSKDIRFFRQHVIDNKGSDYDYRYWLQYEVESMAAGKRSKRILKERDTEYEQAMKKLYELSLNISKSLVSLSEKNSQISLTGANKNAWLLLKEWNEQAATDQISSKYIKMDKRFDAEFESEDSELQNQIKENPLFYLIAKECISVLFKSLNHVSRLRSLKKIREEKNELKQFLPNIDFEIKQGETKKDADRFLRVQLNEELSKPENSTKRDKFYYNSFVCETNILFGKLVDRIVSTLTSWHSYIHKTTADTVKFFKRNMVGKFEFYQPEKSQKDIETIRTKCIKIVTACFVTLNKEEIIELDIGDIEELDYLYSKEYDNKGSHPNVVRLTRKILSEEELNKGDHAIIRHFQQDEKRNMYCLPKEHQKYDIEKTTGNGGFLHHGSKSVSLHYDLLSLVRAKEYDFTRFEPSENTLSALNILQKTQWSINLDFLHFIADFTLDGKIVDDILDIRHVAWTGTNNMELREIFIERMELKKQDTSTISRLRTINSVLTQTRKNLLNAGNVFWHSWFCDWRGRFNPRVTQLSPQGGDLSKSLLLFTEWKKLGKSGKKWLYVKAYDLMHKIVAEEKDEQTHKFEEQENWVANKNNLDKILDISSKLNRKTSYENLNQILSNLQVKKAGPKSEIFQRIAFLIEFNRIHNELDKNNGDWDKVTSGLPIHLDASCNGFQHISALTRNRKLAKSTNLLLSDEGDKKGDLYQEVANKAKELYNGNDEEELAKPIKKLFEKISKSKKEQGLLVKYLFSRDICKPLVMITGYGAKELKDPLMNLNGKKNKPGWYKTEQYEKSGEKEFKTTTHKESILYQKIEQIHDKYDSFGNLIISNEEDGTLSPVQNCVLLTEIVQQLTKYIKKCIAKVTNNGFEVISRKLEDLYQDIDSTGGISLSELEIPTKARKKIDKIEDLLKNLEKLKDIELDKILIENDLLIPKKEPEKIDKIKAHLINKKKNLLYFCWRVSPEASLVRNVRWKVDQNLDEAVLHKNQVLPKGYVASSKEVIIQFILDNNESKEMLERLNNYREGIREEEIRLGKELAAQGYLKRNLSVHINRCLVNIGKYSADKEVRKIADNHYYSRFINQSKSGRLTVNTGKLVNFSKPIKGFHENWAKKKIEILDNMSNDVIRGLVPNFIHSFDAMHMQMIIQELSKNEIDDIWAVHDSFGVHACHVEEMRDIVKNTFVELHKDPLNVHIENIRKDNSNILKKNDSTDTDEKTEVEDSDDSQNNQELFSIKDVLNSKYMIS